MTRLLRFKEAVYRAGFFLCAVISIATTAGIIWVLFKESIPFFQAVPLRDFVTQTEWSPKDGHQFGILPLLCGTMLIAVLSLIIAVPIGLMTAVYMSEYASPAIRQVAKPVFEVLAGVPTVVYGYFALTFITPVLLRPLLPSIEVFNALSASIVVGIMVIPTISSLCDDALRAVPSALRHGAHALAATRLEVSMRVVLPSALSGVVAAILLALARAVGETMAVAIAAGNTPKLTLNPLVSVQTMTGYIISISKGDAPFGTIEYQSIFAVGLTLFLITLAVNFVAERVLARFREAYE